MADLDSFRDEIDALDKDIISLLRKRYDIIQRVAVYKKDNNINAVIPERIEEVLGHVQSLALENNLNPDIIKTLYKQLIDHSCQIEEDIMKHNPHNEA